MIKAEAAPRYPQYDAAVDGNVFDWIVKKSAEMRPALVEAAYNPSLQRLRRL